MSLAAIRQETAEQRSEPRNRVLLGGFLVFGDYAFTPNCVIRNLTGRGAAVRLEGELRLPDTVTIVELTTGRAHSARVVWARNGFVGLAFTASRDLRSAGSHDPLRQLWIDRIPRTR
jgi:hypothetical protein